MNIVGKEDIKDILRIPLFVMWRGSTNPENPNHHRAWIGMVKGWGVEDLFQMVAEHGDPYQAEFSVAPENFSFVVSYDYYKDAPDGSGVSQCQCPELSYWAFEEVYDAIGEIAQGKPMTKEKYWFRIDWDEVR